MTFYAKSIVGFLLLCFVSTHIQSQSTTMPNSLKVIVFLDTECPVSQSYMPVLRRLSEEYSTKGVQFESYFPVYTVTDKEIKQFLNKYKASFRGFTDKDHFKTRQYRATVMPEVVLLDENGVVSYQGAIDNWYVALGKNRPKPSEFYLRDAIEAHLKGNSILKRKTQAVGCLIND
jgi:thiol-disulfide isomerase/thioredoxin